MNPMWHRVFELGIMTGHSCTVYLALIKIKMIKRSWKKWKNKE